MKILFSWLKKYIDTKLPPTQVAKVLTQAGIEVDACEFIRGTFEKIVVGLITNVEKHPSADKLCVATVTDGIEIYQVVCGAPNCRAGMKTAFARIGATLKDEAGQSFTIKKTKIRGVESFGMLCSGKELAISDDHDGIMEFAEHVHEGADVAEMYSDVVFDISLTPNLGHCASYLGIARELSAATGEPIRPVNEIIEEFVDEPIHEAVHVKVHDKLACPRYACRLIKNVKVGPSPEWLQKCLTGSGIRSVNNVVDVTNYVLLELGQPLHAFDFDKLNGHEIHVRPAVDGELFKTLDGKERSLAAGDLLICDKISPVALAGIMGGENSEVTDSTYNVLLESAHFNPGTIRRSSKRLGLQTDASRRFERHVDPNGVVQALDRAAALVRTVTGGEICGGTIDIKEHSFPEVVVPCRFDRINHVLGTHLSLSEVELIFKRLGFRFSSDGAGVLSVHVPTFRADIKAEIDLIEEVARIYGYDNIPCHESRYHSSLIPHAPIYLFERKVRALSAAEGLQEFLTCDLIGPTILDVVRDQNVLSEMMIRVLNPTSLEQSILRTSLLPGLLQTVKYNLDHSTTEIAGYEVGRIHFKQGEHYKEQSVAGIVLSGKNRPHHWDLKPQDFDFYDLKGIIENVLIGLGIEGAVFKESHLQTFHTGRQAAVFVGTQEVGSLGEVHPAIQRRLDASQRIYFAELNLHELFRVCPAPHKMTDLPVYPSSERDWTVTVGEAIAVDQVFAALRSTQSSLLEDISLIDIYRSEKLGSKFKNATFRFIYRDSHKTIEQETVDGEHARVIEAATKKLSNV